jgi:hypothetical protein
MRKGIGIIVLVLAFFTVVGGFIYFVSGISSVSPPIATYSYAGRIEGLVSGIQEYGSTNQTISFKVTDSVGTDSDTYALYVNIGIKNQDRNVMYNLSFKPIDGSDRTKGTLVLFIGAHDLTRKIGGYSINDNEVRDMLNYFESEFLIDLKSKGKIDIVRSSK